MTKQETKEIQTITEILTNFLHTVGCGLCKNENNNKLCPICVNYRSTHIFFDYKKEYLEEIATEIYTSLSTNSG